MKKRFFAFLLFFIFIFNINLKVYADVLDDVKFILKNYYVDDVPQGVFDADSIDEALKALNDPYTQYFTKEEFNDFLNSINKSFSGIGVQIEKVPEGIKIMTVFDSSPAKEAGLKAGDIIIEADGTSFKDLPLENAIKLIRGAEGTSVNLKVKRGDSIFEVLVTRKKIQFPTVEFKKINNIGYIRILSFGETTDVDFKNYVEKNKALDGFIIDLRNNPGGYLQTAVNLGGYFVGQKPIVLLKGKDFTQEYESDNDEILKGKKVVFLVNENSASASEVLTGAIKDYKRGLIIGNKTFGKGTVQTFLGLSDGGVLKLTIQRFYSPKGNKINKVGIQPDIFVKDSQMQFDIAYMLLGKSSKIKKGFCMVKIGDSYYEIDKNLLKNKKYYDAFIYLLNNNYIKEYYDGTNQKYVRIAMKKSIIEKLTTGRAYIERVKTKRGYSYVIRYYTALKKGA